MLFSRETSDTSEISGKESIPIHKAMSSLFVAVLLPWFSLLRAPAIMQQQRMTFCEPQTPLKPQSSQGKRAAFSVETLSFSPPASASCCLDLRISQSYWSIANCWEVNVTIVLLALHGFLSTPSPWQQDCKPGLKEKWVPIGAWTCWGLGIHPQKQRSFYGKMWVRSGCLDNTCTRNKSSVCPKWPGLRALCERRLPWDDWTRVCKMLLVAAARDTKEFSALVTNPGTTRTEP